MNKYIYEIAKLPVTNMADFLKFINSKGELGYKVVSYDKKLTPDFYLDENAKWVWEILFELLKTE